jgi:hypothetical protein
LALAERQGRDVEAQKEVPSQVADTTLDLTPGLRPIWLAGAGHEAVVVSEVLKALVPNDATVGRPMVDAVLRSS